MDCPDYMVINPMHIEFKNIPKIPKVLGPPPYLPSAYKVGWIGCPKCIDIGMIYSQLTGNAPNWFKAITPGYDICHKIEHINLHKKLDIYHQHV